MHFPQIKGVVSGPILIKELEPEEKHEDIATGEQAVVIKKLHPVGVIEINGKRFDAHSDGGVVEVRAAVCITGRRGNEYLVEEII